MTKIKILGFDKGFRVIRFIKLLMHIEGMGLKAAKEFTENITHPLSIWDAAGAREVRYLKTPRVFEPKNPGRFLVLCYRNKLIVSLHE